MVTAEELYNFILSPPESRNKEVEDMVDWLLSHPQPQPTTYQLLRNPPDETVKDLLEWFGTLWVLEPNQEPPRGGPPARFPWAKDYQYLTLHTLDYIHYSLIINTVSATFECRRCGDVKKIEYDIVEKFMQISGYIVNNGPAMGGVAPTSWLFPTEPQCEKCKDRRRNLGEVITKDAGSINWLFLLLGKLIGCCPVHQLKGFCEHNGIGSSGKKPRLVYLTYLGLCRQLDPRGSYDL